MKNFYCILTFLFVSLLGFSQNNLIDEDLNLFTLEEAKIFGSKTGGRGVPIDIIFDIKKDNYFTNSDYAEYGLSYGEKLDGILFWQCDWDDPKLINYLSFGGSYPNQPQPKTSWIISYKDKNDKWITLEKGVGGWISDGVFEFKPEDRQPLLMKSVRVELFASDGSNIKHTHLRARGGKSRRIDDRDSDKRASIALLLPYEKQESGDDQTVVFKELYKVYQDEKLIFEDVSRMKALTVGRRAKFDNPDSHVRLIQPDLDYLVVKDLDTTKVVANITVTKRPRLNAFKVTESKKHTEYGNGCESDDRFLMVSEVPFEFNDIPMILNNVDWYIQKGLTNRGKKISSFDAILKGLIVLKCSKSQVVESKR